MTDPQARAALAFALDVPTLREATRLVESLAPHIGVFKVGLELFISAGPEAVTMVHRHGARCFLDLKLHDIPATVERSVRAAIDLGVSYLTLHAACGPQALRQAAEAARGTALQLLAVTVLTSLDASALQALGLKDSAQQVVLRLATLAADCGVTGMVTSAQECAQLRAQLGADVILVVPGIRPKGAEHGDQMRVASPGDAIVAGANLLVVGRPIRDADNPTIVAQAIGAEVSQALSRAAGRT